MAKRFTDTEKYKKEFIRGLPGAYKLFWDYLYHDCSFAGIWHVDMEVAQIMIGKDMVIEKEKALELFNNDEKRIMILNNGKKWFIRSFIQFQYGELVETNKLHIGVMRELRKEGVSIPLRYPSEGAKDKDKDKDKDKRGMQGGDVINCDSQLNHPSASESASKSESESEGDGYNPEFNEFWALYPKKVGKIEAFKQFKNYKCHRIMDKIKKAIELQKKSKQWLDENGKYIPDPERWIKKGRWNDEGVTLRNTTSTIDQRLESSKKALEEARK